MACVLNPATNAKPTDGAHDDAVADRVRRVLKRRKGISERKMFGGIAFMLIGNMVCGVNKKDLVLRLGEERAAKALTEPHTRAMDLHR